VFITVDEGENDQNENECQHTADDDQTCKVITASHNGNRFINQLVFISPSKLRNFI